MADRGQKVAAAWPPRTWLGLTAPRAGRLEVEHARTLSALPFTLLPSPSQPQQHSADAFAGCLLRRARGGSPWHHRQQALTHSSTVYSSTSSTSPWSHKVKVEAVLLLRGRAPFPARAPSSSRALATASRLTPSRPQIPHHLLYLVHPLVEPIERS